MMKGDRGLDLKLPICYSIEASEVSWEKSQFHYSVASVLGFIPSNNTAEKATHINLEGN